mgnify:FL=1
MDLFIGENIKRLRRERGLTQETLAERLHISAAAVSKWERGESVPDIGMLLPLASYFNVSSDELLGLNAAKAKEKIKAVFEERDRLSALGKEREAFDLIANAHREFPDDWLLTEDYMWKLVYDPYTEDRRGDAAHKEELYALCGRVLDECQVDRVRYSALNILEGLYELDGRRDKAMETLKRFPNLYYTQENLLPLFYDEGSDEWRQAVRSKIAVFAEAIMTDIRDLALKTAEPHESIRILKKAVALCKLVYDEGDYCFSYTRLSDLYIFIAHRYVRVRDIDAALDCFEKGFMYAKAYDELPLTDTHTSFLVRGNVYDKRNTSSMTDRNKVAEELGHLLESDSYRQLKDNERMKALVAAYLPLCGEKVF